MQREIKFRAWIIKENKMSYDALAMSPDGSFWQYADQGYYCNNINASEEHKNRLIASNIPVEDEFVLMQFTGLKDKNGVEIYEGDIVKSHTEKDMVVGWSDRFASFVIKRDGWMFQHWFGEALEGNECEVIGNIYAKH